MSDSHWTDFDDESEAMVEAAVDRWLDRLTPEQAERIKPKIDQKVSEARRAADGSEQDRLMADYRAELADIPRGPNAPRLTSDLLRKYRAKGLRFPEEQPSIKQVNHQEAPAGNGAGKVNPDDPLFQEYLSKVRAAKDNRIKYELLLEYRRKGLKI